MIFLQYEKGKDVKCHYNFQQEYIYFNFHNKISRSRYRFNINAKYITPTKIIKYNIKRITEIMKKNRARINLKKENNSNIIYLNGT